MDQIDVNGLKASSIENENLILGKGDADAPAISGDLDIFDKYGNLMFETVVNETGSSADHYIHGFKVYKYKQNADNTLTPNGFIYLSREGFKEYDAEENMIFGNDGDIFKTQQQVIAKTEGSTTFGARIVPMRIVEYPGTTNEVVHSGIAFLRL